MCCYPVCVVCPIEERRASNTTVCEGASRHAPLHSSAGGVARRGRRRSNRGFNTAPIADSTQHKPRVQCNTNRCIGFNTAQTASVSMASAPPTRHARWGRPPGEDGAFEGSTSLLPADNRACFNRACFQQTIVPRLPSSAPSRRTNTPSSPCVCSQQANGSTSLTIRPNGSTETHSALFACWRRRQPLQIRIFFSGFRPYINSYGLHERRRSGAVGTEWRSQRRMAGRGGRFARFRAVINYHYHYHYH